MKFNIPIVFRIKADTVEEAEDIALLLAQYGVVPSMEDEPKRFKALQYYGKADLTVRVLK